MSETLRLKQTLLAALVATILVSTDAGAKTTGVGDDPLLQSGPCYEALVDKNETNPTTAPKRELGAACQEENGDIDKAWARVVRLWGSDGADLPDYDSYRRADAPVEGTAPKWLAVVGVLLIYAVLGAPMRSAARVFGVLPETARGAAAGAVIVSLVLRALLCAGFVTLFSLPYASALAAAALMAWLIVRPGRAASPPSGALAGSSAARLADVLNDGLGVFAPIAALALFVQQNWPLLGAALALGLVASVGPVIAARRALRGTPLRAAVAAAALAAALGSALVAAPPVSGWVGGVTGAGLIAPLVAAAVTFVGGMALGRPARLVASDA